MVVSGKPARPTRAGYRIRQFMQAISASSAPLSDEDEADVKRALPETTWPLFAAMPRSDQRHSISVLRTLRARGYDDPALAQAALLHDCAKRRGGVTLFHRVAVVLLHAGRPELLAGWAATPGPGPGGWRQGFWAHARHPEAGAELAAAAGCDPVAVMLIRRHQETPGADGDDTSRLLAALQAADDDN